MKQAKILIVLFFISFQIFAQNKISSKTRTEKRIDTEFSFDKLYNKKTGAKVSVKEFEIIVKNNPNLPIERVFDNKGNVVKYLYDPKNANSVSLNDNAIEKVKKGEYFPELELKTIDGETIKIKDLKGKMVILRLEMEADTFRFKKHEIEDLDAEINLTNRKSEIEAIIIFGATTIQQILKAFDLTDSNFKLIPNGWGIFSRLNINRFPTTIILDKEGKLMEDNNRSTEINILDLLNKS